MRAYDQQKIPGIAFYMILQSDSSINPLLVLV